MIVQHESRSFQIIFKKKRNSEKSLSDTNFLNDLFEFKSFYIKSSNSGHIELFKILLCISEKASTGNFIPYLKNPILYCQNKYHFINSVGKVDSRQ
jgi:hypothetical protein